MDNKWSVVGGIMSLVSGAFGMLGGLGLIFFSTVFTQAISWSSVDGGSFGDAEQSVIDLVGFVYGVMGGFLLLVGVLALVGGIFALRRKLWGLALAGSIGAIFCFLPIGIVAVIFTSMSRSEFSPKLPASPNQPLS
jgi:hypothetical protein